MCRANWTFTNVIDGSRSHRLSHISSFDHVIELFRRCVVAPMWWEPATASHLQGCYRASFKLTVSKETYDAFFNAPAGYRGQYALSERAGESANRRLIDSLRPKLLNAVKPDDAHQPVTASLGGSQAKIWIVETEVEEQWGDPNPSIEYKPWEFNEHDGQGLRAPIGTTLEVKGAWITSNGEVFENPYKRNRSSNIYRTGDSK